MSASCSLDCGCVNHIFEIGGLFSRKGYHQCIFSCFCSQSRKTGYGSSFSHVVGLTFFTFFHSIVTWPVYSLWSMVRCELNFCSFAPLFSIFFSHLPGNG